MKTETLKQFAKHPSKTVRVLAAQCLDYKRRLEELEARPPDADDYYTPDVDLFDDDLDDYGVGSRGEDRLPAMATFEAWLSHGRCVNRGEKSKAVAASGKALFLYEQTVPATPGQTQRAQAGGMAVSAGAAFVEKLKKKQLASLQAAQAFGSCRCGAMGNCICGEDDLLEGVM